VWNSVDFLEAQFLNSDWAIVSYFHKTINPLTPGHFAKKCLLKRVKPFLGRCLAKKNPNCPKRCFQVEHWTSFCSWCQITAFDVRAWCRKQNFEIVFFRESFAALSSFTFCFLSSLPLLLFFPPLFFFCGAFTRLPYGGERFCKTFEDCEFFLKEVPVGSWARFSLEFSGQSYTVFCVFLWSVWLNRTHLGMAWKISSPCTR